MQVGTWGTLWMYMGGCMEVSGQNEHTLGNFSCNYLFLFNLTATKSNFEVYPRCDYVMFILSLFLRVPMKES